MTYPVISALRRWLESPPSAEPFEPYARALNDHWTQRRRVRFYIRGRYGPFRRMNSAQGFEADSVASVGAGCSGSGRKRI